MKSTHSAITIIELVFVMVIIGVLAAVGIPKLQLTRQDAVASVLATHLSNCLEMAVKGYYQKGIFDTNDSSCKAVTQIHKCYSVDANNTAATLKIKDVADADNACKASQMITFKNTLSSSQGITHHF